MENKYYVYCHRKKTDGECFYIGKGTGNRYKDSNMRNPHWWNIVNKYNFETEILINNINELKAFEYEAYFCKQIGYKNLCNIREELGNGGWSHSKETKYKISESKKGIPNLNSRKPKTEEWKKNMKKPKSSTINYHSNKTIEHKNKISLSKIGKPIYRFRKPVLQYDLQDNFIKEWNGLVEAAKILNINKTGISNNLIGDSKSCGGFMWKYKINLNDK
jgi:group I intron endonuclease